MKLINDDCLKGLKSLDTESINCVVTSPPYWALRDYGTAKWEGGNLNCSHKPKVQPRKDRERQGIHPTQKPVALIGWLLKKFSQENDLIFDPFLGSGTTAVACEKLGRRWIGIEISEKYCEIAARRIDNEARQGKLF